MSEESVYPETDLSCLAEGLVVEADFRKTGLNLNQMIVGTTGVGKSVSVSFPRIMYTYHSSIVIPIAKKEAKDKFTRVLRDRGFEVHVLDFAHPENSDIGYDPLDFIDSSEDMIQFAGGLIGEDPSRDMHGNYDPYWNHAATSIAGAEIEMIRLRAKKKRKRPSFADVIALHRSLSYKNAGGQVATNLDQEFERLGFEFPGNMATELWKTVKDLSIRTASCIFSIVNSAYDKMFSERVVELMKMKNRIDFRDLGRRKIALFITTSPVVKTLHRYLDILYSDMFRVLFEEAEGRAEGSLAIPVHIVCDDFACGSRIPDFEDYISIFRAAGISVTIMLQSESQLSSMYGEHAATTIINNCDTYVYMGGMDHQTCSNVAHRLNKPVHRIMSMPLEQVMVFRRGSDPYIGRRYQTLSDPYYLYHMNNNDSSR
ncbi:MAG: type IV secretory system conjugative DNA transfer family protein [Lachnospiraceae bacterium]|nr:type IV secretory system conjugative DNA transfer family protein [Lachnospiraceae bacterium]